MYDENLYAEVVFDGEETHAPVRMGVPRSDQLQGTTLERLCELAGRVCYHSLGKGRDSAEYHKHIADVGHGCYDAETEVLTADGWKHWDEVSESDRFATLDGIGSVVYQKPLRLIRKQHRGRMYRVESTQVDLLVTPDHKMYACLMTTREGRQRRDFVRISAEELGTKAHAYFKGGCVLDTNDPGAEARLDDAHVGALLGFAIGDGYIGPRSRVVTFRLRRERKIRFLEAQANRLRWEVRERRNDTYAVVVPANHWEMFKGIYAEDGQKVIPQALLTTSSLRFQDGLLDGLLNSDGTQGETSVAYDTTSAILAGQIQQLCLHLGLAGNISQAQCYENRRSNRLPLYRVTVNRRTLRPQVNKYAGQKGRTQWIDDWEGEVFCAEVPNNTLYVRRNGKTVWSGNSVWEHANFTWEIRGEYGTSLPSGRTLLDEVALIYLNRPGVWVTYSGGEEDGWQGVRVTSNLRAVAEWDAHNNGILMWSLVSLAMQRTGHNLAPQIIRSPDWEESRLLLGHRGATYYDHQFSYELSKPAHPEEKWVSLLLGCSRGASHEQVRHKWRTAVSQRSTRYVDESESPWVEHPLETVRREAAGERRWELGPAVCLLSGQTHSAEEIGRAAYKGAADNLQPWLTARGVDKSTARKQARGAARGYLGNALHTELIFSASVAQWRRMIAMRCSAAADAEIRVLYGHILRALRTTRWVEDFSDITLVPSPDGIGEVAQFFG
jgi:hypothetical protein